MYLPVKGATVPVRKPGKKANIASGPRGSAFIGSFW